MPNPPVREVPTCPTCRHCVRSLSNDVYCDPTFYCSLNAPPLPAGTKVLSEDWEEFEAWTKGRERKSNTVCGAYVGGVGGVA